MFRKRQGSTRIIAAGGSLLMLLVVVAIWATMGGKNAETVSRAKYNATRKIDDIQRRFDEHGRQIDQIINGGGQQDSDEGDYEVFLKSPGARRADVVRVVRTLTRSSQNDAADLVDSAPTIVLTGLTAGQARKARRQLERAGARVEIERDNSGNWQ